MPEHKEGATYPGAVACPAQCNKSDNTLKLRGRSGIQGKQTRWFLRNSTFDDSIKPQISSLIATIYNNYPSGFYYLHGPNGIGKSYIMIAAINEMITQQRSAVYLTTIRLLNKLRESFSDDKITNSDYIEYFKNVTLLCLDEFGREKATEYTEQALFDILDHRYQASYNYDEIIPAKLTIMASNIPFDDIHPYLKSRLSDHTSTVIDMNGLSDWRAK